MARDILGPRWGRYFVGPIQFAVCYGVVVASPLLGGQCMKAIYRLSNPNGAMKLYEFVAIFGCFMLILAQIPSFHSLRHINLVSVVLCLLYSACAAVGSIYIGHSSKGPEKDYSLKGDSENRLFGIFNAVAIIATTYGNGIIPEIQTSLDLGISFSHFWYNRIEEKQAFLTDCFDYSACFCRQLRPPQSNPRLSKAFQWKQISMST